MIAKQGMLVEEINREKQRVAELEQQLQQKDEMETDSEAEDEFSDGYESRIQDSVDDDDSEFALQGTETLDLVEKDIAQAKLHNEIDVLQSLRVKQRVLLRQELTKVQETLVRKNEILNETLEYQEKLTDNAIE